MTPRILVVDDDFDNRAIVTQALTAAGFAVTTACNGLEALAEVEREAPQVILLDMSMPKMSGWDTAGRIRLLKAEEGIPIIALTAYALTGDDQRARAAGCDDYLSKPCVLKEVVAKAWEWVSRGRARLAEGA